MMALLLLQACVLAMTMPPAAAAPSTTLWFVTSDPANDVLALAQQALPAERVRHATLEQAMAGAAVSDAVLVLADGYPWRFSTAPPALLSAARVKKLRLYLEYLDDLPGFDRSNSAPAGGACLQRHNGDVSTQAIHRFCLWLMGLI